jgi:nitroreductase
MGDLLPLGPDELLTTTRAVRRRLDLSRPVPRELIEECLEVAIQAPTGSNLQGWQWVVVDDPEKRQGLADLYGPSFDAYARMGSRGQGPQYEAGDPRAARGGAVAKSAVYLRQHLHEVPVLVVPCIEGRPPTDGGAMAQAGLWGSILPAVWSFMLAARARGLGTAWTTLHLRSEHEAAQLLGIDDTRYTQAGLIPVAYSIGTDFKPASRVEWRRLVHWNTW